MEMVGLFILYCWRIYHLTWSVYNSFSNGSSLCNFLLPFFFFFPFFFRKLLPFFLVYSFYSSFLIFTLCQITNFCSLLCTSKKIKFLKSGRRTILRSFLCVEADGLGYKDFLFTYLLLIQGY